MLMQQKDIQTPQILLLLLLLFQSHVHVPWMGNLTGREQSDIHRHAQTKWWSIRQETESSGVKLAIVTGSLSLQTN